MIQIALNGCGRIGKTIFRILQKRRVKAGFPLRLAAINVLPHELSDFACFLTYDTTMGTFPSLIRQKNNTLFVEGEKIKLYGISDPALLNWEEEKIDVVIEASGKYTSVEGAQMHLKAGAKKVILCAPAPCTLYIPGLHVLTDQIKNASILSLASCTTNCLAPLIACIDSLYKWQEGSVSTIHAYTNDQRLADAPHPDARRARAAGINIIPTKTGAASVITTLFPHLLHKIGVKALRVPVPWGSFLECTAVVTKEVPLLFLEEMENFIASSPFKPYVSFTQDPIVSSDIKGSEYSCMVDLSYSERITPHLIRLGAWYDNEMGYSARVVDTLCALAE